MYEQIGCAQVLQAARLVEEALRSQGAQGIFVHHTRALRGRTWRHGGAYRADAAYVSFKRMYVLLEAGLRSCLAMLGDMVYRQTAGLPIGGPLSDVGSNLLLTLQEATWRNCPPWRTAASFHLSPSPAGLDEEVAAVRYVDDVLAVTGCLCSACLQRLITTRHPGVPFGLEGAASDGCVRWLDLLVRVTASGLPLKTAMSERSWELGGADAPQVFRVQPYLGDRAVAGPLLRCHIRGRLSRWAQLQPAEREVVRSVLWSLTERDTWRGSAATRGWATRRTTSSMQSSRRSARRSDGPPPRGQPRTSLVLYFSLPLCSFYQKTECE